MVPTVSDASHTASQIRHENPGHEANEKVIGFNVHDASGIEVTSVGVLADPEVRIHGLVEVFHQ